MPILIALILAFIIVAVVARRKAPTRACRWREDRAASKGALIKYNCITCGAEAFRAQGQPDRCLSGQGVPRL